MSWIIDIPTVTPTPPTPPGGLTGDIQFNNGGSFGGETLVPLAHGGTNADLSGTGGAHFVLRQSTVGGAITVSQLAYSDISGTPSLNFLPLAGGTLTGDLLFSTDNSHDIGAVGATRPRTVYVGTSVLSPLFNAATGFQVAGAATTGHVL